MFRTRAGLRELAGFAGPAVVRACTLLLVLGVGSLFLELSFAGLLQRLLVALGLVSREPATAILAALPADTGLVVIMLLAVAGGRVAIGVAQGRIEGGSVEQFALRLRTAAVRRCLSGRAIDSAQTLTLINQRIYTASVALQSVQAILWQGTFAAGVFVSLLVLNPKLTVTVCGAVGLLAIWPIAVLNRRLKQSATAQADVFAMAMLHLGKVFRNFLLIRIYQLQQDEEARIGRELDRHSRLMLAYHRLVGLAGTVGPFVVTLIVIGIAGTQARMRLLDPRFVIAYLYLFIRLAQSLAPMASNLSRLAFAAPEFRFVLDWWREPNVGEISDASATRSEAIPPLRGPIGWHLDDVTFGFANRPPLLRNFHLTVAPGSVTLVRGPSGSGKSTLLGLMIGELVPLAGTVSVELDGAAAPAAVADRRARAHLGYAAAEPFLFAGTLYENVTYGLPSLPDRSWLVECAERAACEFVFDLPGQFDYQLDELGQGLSTGQKQRLALLRSLLRRPRALILDEALSNVDVQTEQRILASLVRLSPPCTLIVVSHRDHPSLSGAVVVDLNDFDHAVSNH